MPVNQSIYNNNPQVRHLPIYLVGIGGSEYQGHVCRPEGYYWNQLLYNVKGQGCLKVNGDTITLTEGYFFSFPIIFPTNTIHSPKPGKYAGSFSMVMHYRKL